MVKLSISISAVLFPRSKVVILIRVNIEAYFVELIFVDVSVVVSSRCKVELSLSLKYSLAIDFLGLSSIVNNFLSLIELDDNLHEILIVYFIDISPWVWDSCLIDIDFFKQIIDLFDGLLEIIELFKGELMIDLNLLCCLILLIAFRNGVIPGPKGWVIHLQQGRADLGEGGRGHVRRVFILDWNGGKGN